VLSRIFLEDGTDMKDSQKRSPRRSRQKTAKEQQT